LIQATQQELSTFHREPQGNTLDFTIDWLLTPKTAETIKWMLNEEKYEIHHGLCTKFELNDIMTHCLMVIHKIDGQVGESDNKKLASVAQNPSIPSYLC
jgi:hypothetical protein